jgi:hypothetical protein
LRMKVRRTPGHRTAVQAPTFATLRRAFAIRGAVRVGNGHRRRAHAPVPFQIDEALVPPPAQCRRWPRVGPTTPPSTSTESAMMSSVTEPRAFVPTWETAPSRGWSAQITAPPAILTSPGAMPTRSRVPERCGRLPRAHGTRGCCYSPSSAPVSPHIDEARATYKLQRFRNMFRQEVPGEHATAHDRCLHQRPVHSGL